MAGFPSSRVTWHARLRFPPRRKASFHPQHLPNSLYQIYCNNGPERGHLNLVSGSLSESDICKVTTKIAERTLFPINTNIIVNIPENGFGKKAANIIRSIRNDKTAKRLDFPVDNLPTGQISCQVTPNHLQDNPSSGNNPKLSALGYIYIFFFNETQNILHKDVKGGLDSENKPMKINPPS